MIDYQTYCQIHQLRNREGFKINQIAQEVQLDPKTVSHWLDQPSFQLPQRKARGSKLDPYKPQIIRWLEASPYTGRQIFQRLQDQGYSETSTQAGSHGCCNAELIVSVLGGGPVEAASGHGVEKFAVVVEFGLWSVEVGSVGEPAA